MNQPGDGLRRYARLLVSADAMQRVIDPGVADLQMECAKARSAGQPWAGASLRLIGTITLLFIIGWMSVRETSWAAFHPSDGERRIQRQLLTVSLFAFVLVTSLLGIFSTWLFVNGPWAEGRWAAILLIPQALPASIPVALVLGATVVFAGRRLSPSVVAAAAVLAVLGALSSFAVIGWIAPAANQRFRVAVAGTYVDKGIAETSLTDFRVYMKKLEQSGGHPHERVELRYYSRYALPFAPIVLMLAAVAFRFRQAPRLRFRVSAGLLLCTAYYVLVIMATSALGRGIPAVVAAWLPNVAIPAVIVLSRAARRVMARTEA